MSRDFVLFVRDGKVGCCLVSRSVGLYKGIVLNGAFYRLTGIYLGDFNHLLAGNQHLMGFEFPYWEIQFKELAEMPLFKEAGNAVISPGGDMQIWLASGVGKSDLCQAVGGELFLGEKDIVIVLPEVSEWKAWSEFGFECIAPESVEFAFVQ